MNLKDKPAFPRTISEGEFGPYAQQSGMTLLQYYAGKSLSGLLSTFIAKRLIEKLEKLETNQTQENK